MEVFWREGGKWRTTLNESDTGYVSGWIGRYGCPVMICVEVLVKTLVNTTAMTRVLLTVRSTFAWAPGAEGRAAGSSSEFIQTRCHQMGFAWLRGSGRKVNSAAVGRRAFHALVALCFLHSLASKPRSACGIPASCLVTWTRLCPSALRHCFLPAWHQRRLRWWQGLGGRSPGSARL